ncbi:MAG TPA: 50S ribosomal protein L32 [Terriglobia bacterium]|nr:50S ribosomal protein L32 [Terriglobia bacterium]
MTDGRLPVCCLQSTVYQIMPNPKRRHSKARKNRRRAHDFLATRQRVECPHCHETKLSHHACPHCGYYRGREVLLVEESA